MDNKGKKKSRGTYIKDAWTKTMEEIECGRRGRGGQGRVIEEK